MGYRNYSTAVSHIVDATGQGDFTTVQSAINSASSGQTIFIRPGTYTENPTLKAGVDLVAFVTDSEIPNVIIKGTCSLTSAGTVGLSGIQLQTNGNFALSVTGSAASIVYLSDCYLNGVNSTVIQLTSSSSSSSIILNDCRGNLSTTGISYFSCNSSGSIRDIGGFYLNSGNSTSANTFSNGSYFPNFTAHNNPFSFSGTLSIISGFNFTISINSGNVTAFTYNSTNSSLGALYESTINTGSNGGSAISIGAGATLICDFLSVSSSNTDAITGSGTLKYGLIIYTGTSSTNNVSTQTPFVTQPVIAGGWTLIQTQAASSSASVNFTNLTGYKNFKLLFYGIVPATNDTFLQMLSSTNGGSSYNSSGYENGVQIWNYNSATVTNYNSTTAFQMSGGQSNSGGSISGEVYIPAAYDSFTGTSSYFDSGASKWSFAIFGGGNGASGTVNAIQLQMSSGNITSGSFSLYGIAS